MVFSPKIVHTWFVSKNIIGNVINITRGLQIGGLDPEKLEGAVRKLISYILLNPKKWGSVRLYVIYSVQ